MGNCSSSSGSRYPIMGLDLEGALKHDSRMLQLAKGKGNRRKVTDGVPAIIVDTVQYISGIGGPCTPNIMAIDKSRLNLEVIGRCLEKVEALGPGLAWPSAVGHLLSCEGANVYDAAYILRKFLLDSPEGVVPRAWQRRFLSPLQAPEADRPMAFKEALDALPMPYCASLRFLLLFYHRLIEWQPAMDVSDLAHALVPLTFKAVEGISDHEKAEALRHCITLAPMLNGQPMPSSHVPRTSTSSALVLAAPLSVQCLTEEHEAPQAEEQATSQPQPLPATPAPLPESQTMVCDNANEDDVVGPSPMGDDASSECSQELSMSHRSSTKASHACAAKLPAQTSECEAPKSLEILVEPLVPHSSSSVTGTGTAMQEAVSEPLVPTLLHTFSAPSVANTTQEDTNVPVPPEATAIPSISRCNSHTLDGVVTSEAQPLQPTDTAAFQTLTSSGVQAFSPADPRVPSPPLREPMDFSAAMQEKLIAEMQRQHQQLMQTTQMAHEKEKKLLMDQLQAAQQAQHLMHEALQHRTEQAMKQEVEEDLRNVAQEAGERLQVVSQQVDILEQRLQQLLTEAQASSHPTESPDQLQQSLALQCEELRNLLHTLATTSTAAPPQIQPTARQDSQASSPIPCSSPSQPTPYSTSPPHDHRQHSAQQTCRVRRPTKKSSSTRHSVMTHHIKADYRPSSTDSLQYSYLTDDTAQCSPSMKSTVVPRSPCPASPQGRPQSSDELHHLCERLEDEAVYCETVASRLQELEENAISEFARVHHEIAVLKQMQSSAPSTCMSASSCTMTSSECSTAEHCSCCQQGHCRPESSDEVDTIGPALVELRQAMEADMEQVRQMIAKETAANTEAALAIVQKTIETDLGGIRRDMEVALCAERQHYNAETSKLQAEVSGLRQCLEPLRLDMAHITEAVCSGLDQLPVLHATLAHTDQQVEVLGHRTELLATQLVAVTERVEPRLAEIADLKFELDCLRKRLECVPLSSLADPPKVAPLNQRSTQPSHLSFIKPSFPPSKPDPAPLSYQPPLMQRHGAPSTKYATPTPPPPPPPVPNPITDFLARHPVRPPYASGNDKLKGVGSRLQGREVPVNGGMVNISNPFATPSSKALDDEIAILRQKLSAV